MKFLTPLLIGIISLSLLAQTRTMAQGQRSAAGLPQAQSSGPDKESFSTAIETVLYDFPENLRHITGELVLAEGETENYACTVELPGAERCVITRYHSAEDTTASWQARMYGNDDFGKASREYHALYNKLRACYLQLADSSMIYLKGQWEPAREEIPFATSTLRLNTGDGPYGQVEVQLELLYLADDWVVNINIFNAPLSLSSD